ncbi:hypothetical protein [Clostridium massiliamazoniense]|uniref:hypothetical protein n=1 Tax=Clostridium massiliamazoniense TaxID=1347366 RepID=UPI0006D8130D|nr:hypothetical protein [Clostridium massiliamazoniense]
MYVNFITKVVDTDEIKELIESETEFKVLSDLSNASKREDMVAYKLGISVDFIKSILEEDYDLNEYSEDELFDEYLSTAEEIGTDMIEEKMPQDARVDIRAYTIDEVDNIIKLVMVMANEELGEAKIIDVLRRLLKQID